MQLPTLIKTLIYICQSNLYMPKLVFAKTLILTTEGLLQTLDRKVKILLNQLRGYEIVTVKESSFDFAVEVAKKVAMNNIRLVIGLGGGTALDTAKYAAFVANVAYIAIPTALSNDGVCSPVSVLLAQNGRRHSFTSKIPDGLLIDTDIIFEAPRLLLKAGVGTKTMTAPTILPTCFRKRRSTRFYIRKKNRLHQFRALKCWLSLWC